MAVIHCRGVNIGLVFGARHQLSWDLVQVLGKAQVCIRCYWQEPDQKVLEVEGGADTVTFYTYSFVGCRVDLGVGLLSGL